MKKFRLFSLFLALVLAAACLLTLPTEAKAISTSQSSAVSWIKSKINVGLDYDGSYGNQCVDLIYYYYKYLGFPSVGGNACDYAENQVPLGWKRILTNITPQPGDIAVWKSNISGITGWAGHVGLVVSGNSSKFTVVDQNYAGKNYCTYRENVPTSYLACVIRPNFSTNYSENLGSDFYARIKCISGNYICNINNNVELGKGGTEASRWRFIRQSDGSYKIYSCVNNGLLDVSNADTANGTNIQVCPHDSGSKAQNWLIAKNGSDYFFYNTLSGKCLDLTSGQTSIGTNVQLYFCNGTFAQHFTIETACNSHSYSSKVTKSPTCTATGVRTYTCSKCSATKTESIAATGHNYASATCTKAKTCKACGVTSGSALGHNYSAATCTKAKTCKTCGATSGSALGHNYAAATCTKPETCKVCGVTFGTSKGHTYSNSSDTTCNRCGITRAVIIITKQPKTVNVVAGKHARVTVKATGNGLTYNWYYKNKGESTFTYTPTFKSNSYSAEMNADRNGRQIYCVITDKYGNTVKTKTVTLKMKTVVKITRNLVNKAAANGKHARVTVGVVGDGVTYKWYYKNKGEKKFTYTPTFKSNFYSAEMNSNRNGRQIYCVITDKYGNSVKTKTVTLSMKTVAKVTTNPGSTSVKKGTTAKFTVKAVGDGITCRWQVKTPNGSWKYTTTSGYKTKTIKVSATKARNGYLYRCVITDKYGNKVISNAAKLTVK